jgi:hypothetical protein
LKCGRGFAARNIGNRFFRRAIMERVKFGFTSGVATFYGVFFAAVMPLVFAATAPAQPTNLAVTVRHAPSLNGGTIQGSLQQLNGESVTANGGFTMNGDLNFRTAGQTFSPPLTRPALEFSHRLAT